MTDYTKALYDSSIERYDILLTKMMVFFNRGLWTKGVPEPEIRQLLGEIETTSSNIGIREHRRDLRMWASLCTELLSTPKKRTTAELRPFVDTHGYGLPVITLESHLSSGGRAPL